MAFYLVHAGTKLYKVDTFGNSEELTLPSGVTLSSSRRGRFAILERAIAFVHAPTINLQIDPNLNVRILTPTAPTTAPTVAAGGGGLLTGAYRWAVSFRIMSGTRVIAESAPSEVSNELTLAAQQGSLTNIPVSTQPGVNARGIYRTAANGEELFLVATISDNTTTTYADNTEDEELPTESLDPDGLGDPPGATTSNYIEEIVEWRKRLWAVSNENPDRVYYSEVSKPYAWNQAFLTADPPGEDVEGVTTFAPRRDELGIGKRRSFWKAVGDTPARFAMIRVNKGVGIWAKESVRIIRDRAIFLGEDGVYEWASSELKPLSRGTKVEAWFTGDNYFNRAMFPNALGSYNGKLDAYELYLASPGSTVLDRWVTYYLKEEIWLGPHKTDAEWNVVSVSELEDSDGLVVPVIGASDGNLYARNGSAFEDAGTAIDFDVIGKFHDMGDPKATHHWGHLTMFNKIESAGTLTVYPKVGTLGALQGPVSVTTVTRGAQDPVTLISVVTVNTATNHEYGTGDEVTISGATEPEYNGTWVVTVTGVQSFTFELPTDTPTTPATGTIEAEVIHRTELTHDLTQDEQAIGILGTGRLCQLRFRNAELGQGVELHGYEIDPVNDIGRR